MDGPSLILVSPRNCPSVNVLTFTYECSVGKSLYYINQSVKITDFGVSMKKKNWWHLDLAGPSDHKP